LVNIVKFNVSGLGKGLESHLQMSIILNAVEGCHP